MNKNLTEIAFILDRSGSMQSCCEQAIAGFNQFLAGQIAADGDARLTLVLFDSLYEVVADAVPLREIVPLDGSTFVPRGSTALLDAIGRTIDAVGNRLAAIPDSDRPGAVIIAILTDGEENSSQTFTWRDVSAKIAHQTDVYRWQFLFLGAGADAIATASNLSIPGKNSSQFVADGVGVMTSTAALGRKLRAMRAEASGKAMTQDMKTDLDVDFYEIVREEDQAGRKES